MSAAPPALPATGDDAATRGTPTTLAHGLARRDNNFNLIRLIAAWLVIYGHSYAITADPGRDLILRYVQIKFAGGVAVDVFFFVSGVLIAASLARHSLREYLVARVLRIYPALLVCVALTVFVLGPLATVDAGYWRDPQTWRYLWVNATLWSTEHMLPGVFAGLPNQGVNGSLWSLPIEVRLYLVLALVSLVGLFRPERFNACFVVAMAVGFLVLGTGTLKPADSNSAWCTAYFLTGAFCWHNRERIPLSWPLLFAVLCVAAATFGGPRYHVGYFLAVCYGVLMLAFVPRLPVIRHTDLSYGLYLYGWPTQQLVQLAWPTAGWGGNTAVATVLALLLAWASWTWIEAPALRLKHRLVGARPAARAAMP
ncbi:acyltransferase family protein [Chiayiivirga flava]|uniref:Peptidoglycan/LPS O-acetylase OafA/YrhL n=1 Tax=Chiayiivirga flava TaxID=659595 RepID=A0A7W8D797_9GAMM|nr:peptidoglycan/LPS O-acetylase OafA/YrhL [Chiayiivirga flava]